MTASAQPASVVNKPEYLVIALDKLHSSPTNPRTTFDPAYISELARSIDAQGVLQPITVRPYPNKHGDFEIVAGECRVRGARVAKQPDIHAMVRNLTDAQVLEIQIVENLQRKDIAPIDEATGFKRLMDAAKLTAKQIAEKVGKSEEFVYSRIKLLDLGKPARDAFVKGELHSEHAVLIARLAPEDQERALRFALPENEYDEVPNVKEMREWINKDVRMANAREAAKEQLAALAKQKKKAHLISSGRSWDKDAAYMPAGVLFAGDWKPAEQNSCNSVVTGVYTDKTKAGKTETICCNEKCKTHFPPSYGSYDSTSRPSSNKQNAKQRREKENLKKLKEKAKTLANDRAMSSLLAAAKLDREDLRIITRVLANDLMHVAGAALLRRRGSKPPSGYFPKLKGKVDSVFDTLKTDRERLLLMLELALCSQSLNDKYRGGDGSEIKAIEERYKVDRAQLFKAALDELMPKRELQTSTPKTEKKAAPAKKAKRK